MNYNQWNDNCGPVAGSKTVNDNYSLLTIHIVHMYVTPPSTSLLHIMASVKRVLSIQGHPTRGYAGNTSATFTLQVHEEQIESGNCFTIIMFCCRFLALMWILYTLFNSQTILVSALCPFVCFYILILHLQVTRCLVLGQFFLHKTSST